VTSPLPQAETNCPASQLQSRVTAAFRRETARRWDSFRVADRELDVFGQRHGVVGGQIRGSASIASVHLCHPNFAQPVYVHQLGVAHQTSLRSPSTMMSYSSSLFSREAGTIAESQRGSAADGQLAPFSFHLGQDRHQAGCRPMLTAQESSRCLGAVS